MVSNFSLHVENSISHEISLFLLQAFKPPQTTVDEAQLTLTEPTPEKVPGSYKQLIRVNGEKMILQTANHHTNSGLFFYSKPNNMKALSVPVDDWLRTQLSTVEKAVMAKVNIPLDIPKSTAGTYAFRPLLLKDTLLVTVSKWCKYFKFDKSKGAYELLEEFIPFKKGQFSVNIEVSHVYIGPHKGGQNFSLSVRITQIMYNEDDKENGFQLDEEILTRVLSSASPQSTPRKKKAEKRVKKTKADTDSKAIKTELCSV